MIVPTKSLYYADTDGNDARQKLPPFARYPMIGNSGTALRCMPRSHASIKQSLEIYH